MNLSEKTIVITGGTGFLGTHVCDILKKRGMSINSGGANVFTPRSTQFDLTTEFGVKKLYELYNPDIIIHLAAVVGGIGANRKHPGSFYYKNVMMGALLMEYARRHDVEKFVAIGTICAYPKHAEVPFKENDIWDGYPEETNAPYGLAKKMMLVQAQAYREEYSFNAIYLLPVNLYGPGDNFDPESSHVIPALIKKCVDARESNAPSIDCWGTGTATREFLYVKDAAEAIVSATEKYDDADPINIGTSREISILNLVSMIAKMVGYKGTINWDTTKPDGQPRRCLDVTRARKFGFEARTKFEDGLQETIGWYEEHRCRSNH